MIHLDYLKTFLDIAETGSFRKAAEKNFVTPPAVSLQIKQLEEKLGVKLFELAGKKAYLNSSGKQFLTNAKTITQQFDEAKLSLNGCDVNTPRTIRIAAIYSIGL